MSKGTLSLVMIARNEESIIGQSLASVKDICDEMIVIDTGSTDKTKEIALSYGAKVFDFAWIDHFAAARNESINHATSDWLLMLDADEVIPETAKAGLRKILEENDKSKVYNVNIENLSDGGDVVKHYNFRLFPNDPEVRFVNRIHEALQMNPKRHKTCLAEGVKIVHYGYLNVHKVRKGTNERNLRILLKEVEDNPDKHFMNYYIAQQYLLNSDLDKSLEYYKKALKELTANKIIESDIFIPLIYVGMTKIYQMKKDINSMRELAKIETCSPDFYVELGTFFFQEKKYAEAIPMYEKALGMRFGTPLSCAYDEGSMTWKPYAGLGNTYQSLNLPSKAMDNFKLALNYKPDHTQLLRALFNLCIQNKLVGEAEQYIKKLSEIEPVPQNFIDLANLYMNTRRENLAIPLYLKYANIEALISLQGQLQQSNKYPEALATLIKHMSDNKLILAAPYRNIEEPCLTVVIPTLYKAQEELKYSVEQLEKNELVKQIIIIDNRQGEVKSFKESLPQNDKIKVIEDQPDLFVNGAWNYGMSLCDTKYYLLLNDDVLCHEKVINDCINILENDFTIGLLQIPTAQQNIKDYIESIRPSTTNNASTYFIQDSPQMTGWFIFGRKEDWQNIPTDLKYFFGDNIIYINTQLKKKKIVKVLNKHISHAHSVTVTSLDLYKKGLLESELVIFKQEFPKLFPNVTMPDYNVPEQFKKQV